MIRPRIRPLVSGLVLASTAVVLSLKISGTAGFGDTSKQVSQNNSPSCSECPTVVEKSDFRVARKGFSDRSSVTTSSSRPALSRSRIPAQTLPNSAKIESGKLKIPTKISSSSEEDVSDAPLLANSSFPEKIGTWSGVNHQLPGNYLLLDGKRGEIQQYQKAPGSVGVGLLLDVVSDDERNDEPADTTSPAAELATQTEIQSSPVNATEGQVGFTYEEELFRTKWGWAAFDQVRKTIREDTTQ